MGQTPCNEDYISVLGGDIGGYKGFCMAQYNDTTIVLGLTTEDSVVFTLINLKGRVIQSRSISTGETGDLYLISMYLDSDKNIVASGKDVNCFIMKYDIKNDQLLWFKKFVNSGNYDPQFIKEQSPGGDYIFSLRTIIPYDLVLMDIVRSSGKRGSNYSKVFNLDAAESMVNISTINTRTYGIGRFTNGPDYSDMRAALVELDVKTGILLKNKLFHTGKNQTSRIYGVDIVNDGQYFYSLGFGNEAGTDLDNNKLFLYKTDINGNLIITKRYDIQATSSEWASEIVRASDGLIILSFSASNIHDLFVIKVDFDGNFIWGKKVPNNRPDRSDEYYSFLGQSLVADDNFYFISYNAINGVNKVVVGKIPVNGTTSCDQIKDLEVIVSDIKNPAVQTPKLTESKIFPSLIDVPRDLIKNKLIRVSFLCAQFPADGFELGPNLLLTCLDTAFVVKADAGYKDYEWSNGSNNAEIQISQPGIYTLEATDYCGNIFKDTLIVDQNPSDISIQLHDIKIEFPGDVVLSPSLQGLIKSINWFTRPNVNFSTQLNPLFYATMDTVIWAVVVDSFGCEAVDSMHIIVCRSTDLNLVDNLALTCVEQSFEIQVSNDLVNIMWSNGSTDRNFVITAPGTYILVAKDRCDKVFTDTINVYPNPGGISISLNDTLLDSYQNIILNPDIDGSLKDIIWYSGSGIEFSTEINPLFYAATDTVIWAVVVDSFGCEAVDSMHIIVCRTTDLNLVDNLNLTCVDQSFEIHVSTDLMNIMWSNGSTDPVLVITAPGTYILVASDRCDKVFTDTINVYPNPGGISIILSDTLLDSYQNIILNPNIEGNLKNIVWYSGNGNKFSSEINPVFNFEENTKVWAVVTDSFGCISSDTMVLRLTIRNCSNSIFIPNVFSPNNDGINDWFTIYSGSNCVTKIKRLLIFSRWGENVFERYDFLPGIDNLGWDGRLKGKYFDPATFAYYAEIEMYDRSVILKKGDVTIIR